MHDALAAYLSGLAALRARLDNPAIPSGLNEVLGQIVAGWTTPVLLQGLLAT